MDQAWLAASSEIEEALALTASLVAKRSLPGEEADVQQVVIDWLRANDLPAEVKVVAEGRPNVTSIIRNGDGPTLLLNGHVDTAIIDPKWDQNRLWGKREGDRYYGLGAGDMKSGVAIAMLATRALARRRDLWRGTLIFTSVVDEEAFSIGARDLIADGITADYCIVTESCFDWPSLGSFGKVLVRVDVTGKYAHAAWPERGINAAVEASKLVARLHELPVGTHPRIRIPAPCVLQFHSGPTTYQSITVPDQARFLINWFTVPGETGEMILDRIRGLISDLQSPATFDLAIDPPYYPAWETPVDAPIAQVFADAYEKEAGKSPAYGYTGFGDMNLFSVDAGIPVVMFGARGDKYHEADEYVDVTTLGPSVRVLLRMALDLLPA